MIHKGLHTIFSLRLPVSSQAIHCYKRIGFPMGNPPTTLLYLSYNSTNVHNEDCDVKTATARLVGSVLQALCTITFTFNMDSQQGCKDR